MFKQGLILTKTLVMFSIFASMGSYYTISKGWGVIYPFSTYKLFSQPFGNKHTYSHYRIYTKAYTDQTFRRNKIHATPSYSLDDYVYTLNLLTERTVQDSLNRDKHKIKLNTFVQHVLPEQKEYKIVSETYHPMEYLKKGSYDTATVISF